jgi:hypothetical protein
VFAYFFPRNQLARTLQKENKNFEGLSGNFYLQPVFAQYAAA